MPIELPSARKVTVPVGVPAPTPVGATVAVKLTDWPKTVGLTEEATLAVCPARTYQGEESAPRRMWALAVQLYGVRSARNWGHGDFTDLSALVDLAADLRCRFRGL